MQNMFDPSQLFSGKDFGFKQKPQELLWETEEASNENEFYFHRQCLFIELPKENVRLKQIAKTCEICQNSSIFWITFSLLQFSTCQPADGYQIITRVIHFHIFSAEKKFF